MNAKPDTSQRDPKITVRDLTMAYGDFVIQRDLNFTIRKGDVFIIMGGSGCGKSTLMRVLMGLKSPAKGQVLYGSESFWEAESDEQQQLMRRIGAMFHRAVPCGAP